MKEREEGQLEGAVTISLSLEESCLLRRSFHNTNLAEPLKSLNSMLRRGKKLLLQNGQVVFKFESSAVHPAIISSS